MMLNGYSTVRKQTFKIFPTNFKIFLGCTVTKIIRKPFSVKSRNYNVIGDK